MLSVLVLASVVALAPAGSEPLPDATPVHLGLALAVTHTEEIETLRRDLQDPTSPRYHQWLTPEDYGARFGQPPAVYAAIAARLRAGGFQVTESPNRTFIEALGTAATVRQLLGVRLRHTAHQPPGVHAPDVQPRFPAGIDSVLVYAAGLDTRVYTHHHLVESGTFSPALGPQDIRRFYNSAPLLAAGYVGQEQELVVLGEAEPPASVVSPQAIEYYLRNVSDARAQFIYEALPNPQEDDDPGGGNEEFEPDVELQSIGSPGAKSITLVASPASEVFSTGANFIVNHHASATAVSVSLGICEQFVGSRAATALETLVTQGTVEGQTWSAATGDSGSNDCQNGKESVDFPASVPQFVAMGGSEVQHASFNADEAITAYQQEVVWSEPRFGAAGGGGLSKLFPTPAYQGGLGVTSRSLPDLVLLAGNPGVAADSSNPFIQLPMAAQLTPFEGTSAASPLSAGFFALIASRIGCRLGDPHTALYALGKAQFSDGGVEVFHDITTGTNSVDGVPGFSAGVGYDSASGWGSLDVEALAEAWPHCPPPDAGFGFDGGVPAESPYSQCAFIACDAGIDCVTIPEGPSSCEVHCSTDDPCAAGALCTPGTIYGDAGLCVAGCATDSDCFDAGTVCNACEETCVVPGDPDASVGMPCTEPSQCLTSGLCLQEDMNGNVWPGGYCTTFCDPTGTLTACSCPPDSICSSTEAICLQECPAPGHGCRSGYACQPDGDGTSSCQLPCQIVTEGNKSVDTCRFTSTPDLACDVDSGVCGGPQPIPDAGVHSDAGTRPPGDAGPASDAGRIPPPIDDLEPPASTPHCGCAAGSAPGDAMLLLGVMLAWARRRRPLR